MARFFENRLFMALESIVLGFVGAFIVDNVIKRIVCTKTNGREMHR